MHEGTSCRTIVAQTERSRRIAVRSSKTVSAERGASAAKVAFRSAEAGDALALRALLRDAGLPFEDVASSQLPEPSGPAVPPFATGLTAIRHTVVAGSTAGLNRADTALPYADLVHGDHPRQPPAHRRGHAHGSDGGRARAVAHAPAGVASPPARPDPRADTAPADLDPQAAVRPRRSPHAEPGELRRSALPEL